MFRKVQYDNWGYPMVETQFGLVDYIIIGDCCYFSGVSGAGKVTSTINAAESIILAIAQQENKEVNTLRFFDLQTHLGYHKPIGEFAFNELVIEQKLNGPHVKAWQPLECPDNVLEIFKEQIGQLEKQVKVWKPEEAKEYGYMPTDMCSYNLGDCLQYIRSKGERKFLLKKLERTSPSLANKAKSLLGSGEFDVYIIVDRKDEEDTKYGRYNVWSRDKLRDN